ncbi:MAG: AMP-dependent synthetase/ligase [Promethearchaeota archaeon]
MVKLELKDLSEQNYNLNQFLIDAKNLFPKKSAMMYLKGNVYYDINWEETYEVSRLFCLGLMSLGVERGDKIGIFAHSRYEWRLCDYAILLAGACTVPLYPSLTTAQIEYIVNDSRAKILFVENSRMLRRVLTAKEKSPSLQYVIVIAPQKDVKKPNFVLTLDDLIEKGNLYYNKNVDLSKLKYKNLKKLIKKRAKDQAKIAKSFVQDEINLLLKRLRIWDAKIGTELNDPFIKRYHSVQPEDLASIVYTSGTTGVPKGAMLTHKNFYTNVINTLNLVPITSADKSLAFLPLSHVLGRLTDHFLMTKLGATVAFAKNTDTIIENLAQVRPTYMTAVPRIFEKIWDKLIAKIEEEGGKKEKIFWDCVDWGQEYQTLKRKGEEPSFKIKLKNKLAHTFVFDKIKEKLGGRIRFMFSGGAALSVQIARFFQAADIKILEGYGLTETSPVLTVNTFGKEKIGTVGTPIPETDIKIAPDGEIMAKGPQVFKGYINKPEETKACFSKDGYFFTGDLGELDEEGFLKITGRKKTLIVLRTGKKVSPVMVEDTIKSSRFIEQACLIGDDQKFITALIVPNFEFLAEWAKENNIANYKDDELVVDNSTTREQYAEILEKRKDLIKKEAVIGFLSNIITKSQKELSNFEKAKKFAIVPDDWNEYNELLTPSLKVKRRNIIDYYSAQIQDLYGNHYME